MKFELVSTRDFNGVRFDCYQEDQGGGDFWVTREQIGRLLEYAEPREAIKNIHSRNRERLDKFSLRYQIDTPAGMRETMVYNFKGLLEICRFSNQPKANAVMDYLWNVADDIRKHGFYATPETAEKILADPDVFIRVLQELKAERSKVRQLTEQAEANAPKIVLANAIETSGDSVLIGNFAAILKQNGVDIGQNRLFTWFREKGWLIKCRGRRWNMPTQRGLNEGFLKPKSA